MTEKQVHLLIVEDEVPLREATAERLEEHGYLVVQTGSGEEALEKLADFAFDVVITDLRLPRMMPLLRNSESNCGRMRQCERDALPKSMSAEQK